jgi:hypothetical protein
LELKATKSISRIRQQISFSNALSMLTNSFLGQARGGQWENFSHGAMTTVAYALIDLALALVHG